MEDELPSTSEVPILTKIRTEVLSHFVEEIEYQMGLWEEDRDRWRKCLQLYDCPPETKEKTFPWPGACNTKVNLSGEYVDSVVARIMQSTFTTTPHWVATQLNKQWADAARPLERYLDWGRKYIWDQYGVVKKAVLECCKLGTSIIYNGWQEIALRRYNVVTNQAEDAGEFRGPKPEWIAREDFLIPKGYVDIATAPFVAVRWWFSPQEYERLRQTGFFGLAQDNFNPRKVEDTDVRLRQERSNDPSSGLVCLYQVWFAWDLDGDGYPEEHIMWLHLSTKTLHRYEANPYLHGMRPFVRLIYIEREGEFDGIGIPESIEQYQDEVTTIHRQRGDNRTIANVRGAVARRGCGLSQNEKWYPGAIKFVTDPKNDLVPFQLGEVYPSSQTDEQITIRLAEQRVGVNDVNQGLITPPIGRATATTVISQLQEGTRRFDLNTSEVRRALSLQGMQICELWQTHGLPEPNESNSPEQILDPEDAFQVRRVFEHPEAIRGILALELNISTAAINKEVEKQSSIQLFQMVTGYYAQLMQLLPLMFNPQVPPQLQQVMMKMVMGSDKMMQQIFQSHSRFDLDGVLVSEALQELLGGLNGNGAGQMAPQMGGAQGPFAGGTQGSVDPFSIQ